MVLKSYICFRLVSVFFKNHCLSVVVTTSILTIQTLLAVRMASAKKASDVVPHLISQLIAFIVWASTGSTTGLMILYGIVFKGENYIRPNNTLDESAFHFPDEETWGVASGTMLFVALLSLLPRACAHSCFLRNEGNL